VAADAGAERARGAGDLPYTHDVHPPCTAAGVQFTQSVIIKSLLSHYSVSRSEQASFFWPSWARVIRGRLPVIGRPNADILHHGPPPAYAHGRPIGCWRGRGVDAGACMHPARRRSVARGRDGRPVSGARRPWAGEYRRERERDCSWQDTTYPVRELHLAQTCGSTSGSARSSTVLNGGSARAPPTPDTGYDTTH
jgi:hypothetical protein